MISLNKHNGEKGIQNHVSIKHQGRKAVEVIQSSNSLNEISNQDQRVESQTQISLEDEEKLYQAKAKKREEIFASIILNGDIEFSWVACLRYLFGIGLIGFISTTPFTLIPAHDLIYFLIAGLRFYFMHLLPPLQCIYTTACTVNQF